MAVLMLVFLAVSAVLAFLGFNVLAGSELSIFDTELGKWLLTLSAGAATAGFFAASLRYAEERRASRESWADRHAELSAVYDEVLVARLRISAHRTAKTYSEQISQLTLVRARLKRLGDDPAVRGTAGLRDNLKLMWRYLETLGIEYQTKYLRLARQQRADEAFLSAQAKLHAEQAQPLPAAFFDTLPAGLMLRDSVEFPYLTAFVAAPTNPDAPSAFDESQFVAGFEAARAHLEKKARIRRRPR